jgi:phosphoenolpyruvate synthase/pyruvate phosphate dikinase
MIRPGLLSSAAAQVDVVPPVVDLDAEFARRADVVGAKAAALARARAAGIRVLPGFVVTTAATRAMVADAASPAAVLHDAWTALSDAGRLPLVVRSSSTVEDGGSQSMAGLFASVLDVRGWERFLDALDEVVRSGGEAPIAVLVQPFLQPAWGGVLFGADPVTGRADRLVVAAVPGGPDRLVSGQVDGVHMTLSARGRLREASADVPDALLARRTRRDLVRLARRAS